MKKIKIGLMVATVMIIGLFLVVSGSLSTSAASKSGKKVIIVYKAEVTNQDIEKLEKKGAKIKYNYRLIHGVAAELDEGDIEDLRMDDNIKYIEPDYEVYIDSAPNDPGYDELWGLHNTGQTGGTADADIDAPEAWGLQTGNSNVVIAVIDTGVDYNHEDLSGNIWTNSGEIPGNDIDDDGNGFIDDVWGWDFSNNDNDPFDDNGHGTHCAGTIAAIGNNGVGVVGVNWTARIMSLKFLNAGGSGSTSGAIAAVEYVTMMKQNFGVPVIVTSNSWGGGSFSQSLKDTIAAADAAGILFVAAAGNSGSDNDIAPHYPSSYNLPNVIAVAATDHNDEKAGFSCYGVESVDLGAPGVNIYSTVPTGSCSLCDSSGYKYLGGTSMATPHVAGAVGLIKAQAPAHSHLEIKDLILNSVDPIPSLSGKTVTGGRLNVHNAILNANPHQGSVSLDKDVYTIPDILELTVFDADLDTTSLPDTTTVELISATEIIPEIVTLTETGAHTKTFVGSIEMVTGTAIADGKLQAAHNDTVTVTYYDAYDGTGPAVVTDTAVVDAQAPEISGVVSVPGPGPTQASITWTTDELSDSLVRYGTSSADLAFTSFNPIITLSHTIQLFGLAPETVYYFDVESTDEAGNITTDNNSGLHYTFTTFTAAPILFVDDDEGDAYESYFTNALDANGYNYDVWDVYSLGTSPMVSDMSYYSLVVWNTGYNYSQPTSGLTAEEQSNIAGYLDGGGKMFISGQDILYSGVSVDFLNNYLHVAAYTNDTQTTQATGVAGDSISDGMNMALSYPFTNWADSIQPGVNSAGIFTTNVVAGQPYCALRYPASGPSNFKMVFFAFPFEAISGTASDPNNQKTVMNRIISWLQGALIEPVADAGPDRTVSDVNGDNLEEIILDGSGSTDPDGDINFYEWKEGDITLSNDVSFVHGFTVGVHIITLTVTDNDDLTDSDDVVITVNPNQPPVANAGLDRTAFIGNTVFFDGSDSFDPDGDIISYEWNFADGTFGTGITMTHVYLVPAVYEVSLTVIDNGELPDSDTAIVNVMSGASIDNIVNADIPVEGAVTGNYTNTHNSEDTYESIQEIESKGKPANRYSHLEHKWTIDVIGGSEATFYVEAYHTGNSENDNFVFAYSKDDVAYTDMITVAKIVDDNECQIYELPGDISGTVYIRVKDTNRTAGNRVLDTIYIDHMFVRSVPAPPSYGVSITIDEVSQTVKPGESTSYTVRVRNTGNFDASYSVDVTGTAVNETTIIVDPLSWNTGTIVPDAENIYIVAVFTDSSTSENLYTLVATAICDQDATVMDSAVSNLVVSSAVNTMHINSIVMSLHDRTAGNNTFTHAKALVAVVDAGGAAVQGVTVEGSWSNATNDIDYGVTDNSGEVSLDSDEVKNAQSGTTFVFTVDNLIKDGWEYDASSNVKTNNSIVVD